jgi:hypothetical protein
MAGASWSERSKQYPKRSTKRAKLVLALADRHGKKVPTWTIAGTQVEPTNRCEVGRMSKRGNCEGGSDPPHAALVSTGDARRAYRATKEKPQPLSRWAGAES